MKKETESKIIDILKENAELECISIKNRLEGKGCELTYDTISKYLKSMYSNGKLKRRAKARPGYGKPSWNFYYSLK